MSKLKIVSVCQREGCDKPLIYPNDVVYLLIRDSEYDRVGRQCVFCRECATEIQSE